MANAQSKTNLLFHKIEESKRLGESAELNSGKTLQFSNLNVDSIKPKRNELEYSSVKLKTELFDRIKQSAEQHGVKQPGKFISLILEAYLEQAQE